MYPMYHEDFEALMKKVLAGVLVLALLALAAGLVLLWRNRRGTPGSPVELYHRIYCDGLALNGDYITEDREQYPRQQLLVDLSDSILTTEEKAEVLALVAADWPMLEVVDCPVRESEQDLHGRPPHDGQRYQVNGETITLDDTVQLYYLSCKFMEGCPPREELGTKPVSVFTMMMMGGYSGCSITYIHRSGKGWVERERGPALAHS